MSRHRERVERLELRIANMTSTAPVAEIPADAKPGRTSRVVADDGRAWTVIEGIAGVTLRLPDNGGDGPTLPRLNLRRPFVIHRDAMATAIANEWQPPADRHSNDVHGVLMDDVFLEGLTQRDLRYFGCIVPWCRLPWDLLSGRALNLFGTRCGNVTVTASIWNEVTSPGH